MAMLTSEGLYEPSGLRYLITEGLLSNDSDSTSYRWHDGLYEDEDGTIGVEEILRVDSCVVWSRNGTVKQVFNLDIEGEAILHAFATSFASATANRSSNSRSQSHRTREAALVVVLKTQAHIFTLSGSIHIIPLSYRVARALPFDGGFILQPDTEPSRKPNASRFPNPSLTRVEDAQSQPKLVEKNTNLSPTYCVTDLLAEFSFVAANYTRSLQSVEDCPVLTTADEVLYLSTRGELPQASFPNVTLAVTRNTTTAQTTIWQVSKVSDSSPAHAATLKSSSSTNRRKRQSSNVHERARVPSGRGPPDQARQSFGLMQSFVGDDVKPQSSQLSNIEHLAAELGRDFEPLGVQTRSARRISSMLARTDLVPANERAPFSETVRSGRKSMSRTVRQEGSFGSFTDRHSIGARKSFPYAASVHSNTTSFLNAGPRSSLGESMMQSSMPQLHTFDERLQKNLLFTKIKSFTKDRTDLQPRILLLPHPLYNNADDTEQRQISICIHEGQNSAMTVVTLGVKYQDASPAQTRSPVLKAIQLQRGNSIADACVVEDGGIHRLLVLSRTSTGDDVLHLEAPWSASYLVPLPSHYIVAGLANIDRVQFAPGNKASGDHLFTQRQVKLDKLLGRANRGHFVGLDSRTFQHQIRVQMKPRYALASRVLDLCQYVLPSHIRESMLLAYWEVDRWLSAQDGAVSQECTTLAVTLFLLAVPFINALQTKPTTPGRRKKGLNIRSSSGTLIETASLAAMQHSELARQTPAWPQSACWAWTTNRAESESQQRATNMPRALPHLSTATDNKSLSILAFTDLTREFLQSPAGENMTGPEGYLPTAMNQDRMTRRTSLATIVVALYLLLEELKLEVVNAESVQNDRAILAALLAQLSSWLQWPSWVEAMLTYVNSRYITSPVVIDKLVIDGLETPAELFPPTTIFEAVDEWLNKASHVRFRTLHELVAQSQLDLQHPLLLQEQMLLPKLSALTHAMSSNSVLSPSSILSPDQASQLADVVSYACKQRTTVRNNSGPQSSNDLDHCGKAFQSQTSYAQVLTFSNRDVRTICNQALDAETTSRWDASSELDRQAITKLMFRHDRRFQEASKLVNQARKPELEYEVIPGWTEAETLEAQKTLAHYATRRTYAVVAGRGMMHYMSRTPLMTEQVPKPQFSMSCILRPKTESEEVSPMTIDADKSLFMEDKMSWAYFHSGASAGLMISSEAEFIDTSWILYNKPADHLNNRHAGFLLALGLNGHLKNLAKWVAFKYLTPKHTMTSIGLLLGMAASYCGTADSLVTRLLSVHVTCLLPPGAAELNISPLTQATGLIGVGLVFHNSQHRRMSEVMLSELECQDTEEMTAEEPVLRDEGYRLAAGMALGLINLGSGQSLHALHDMRVAERLLSIAVGTKNVNIVQILDRATAGAVIAISFIYMKTNNRAIASKIDIPDTALQFDYVRPDVFLLRTMARHIILWDDIAPTIDFVRRSLPERYAHRASLRSSKRLITNDLPYFHIVAGICFALALKHAGSQRHDVRDLLVEFLDQFMRIARIPALTYDARVTLNGIRNCLDITALSCAIVMAGSGDLVVYRRLRALHGRVDKETPFGSHLAAHMAIGTLFLSGGTATLGTSNLAVAAMVIAFYPLFPVDVLDNRGHLQALRHLWVLAVEHRCLVLRDTDDGSVLNNFEVKLLLKDGTKQQCRAPCLLPDIDLIVAIEVVSDTYWPFRQDLDAHSTSAPGSATWRDLYKQSKSGVTIMLQKRALYDRIDQEGFNAELEALDKLHITHRNTTVPHGGKKGGLTTLDWVFDKHVFTQLDQADREMLQYTSVVQSQTDMREQSNTLRTTPVDAGLNLDIGTLGPEHAKELQRKPLKVDKLWQIRLLLSWTDKLEDAGSGENHDQVWLRRQVIDRLRARIWSMNKDADENSEGRLESQ